MRMMEVFKEMLGCWKHSRLGVIFEGRGSYFFIILIQHLFQPLPIGKRYHLSWVFFDFFNRNLTYLC